MELSRAMLEELTGFAERHLERRPLDKRMRARIPWARQIEMVLDDDAPDRPAVRVRSREISTCGISILAGHSMRKGDQFFLYLPRKSSGFLRVRCRVTRWRQVAEGLHAIGACFLSIEETVETGQRRRASDAAHRRPVQRPLRQVA